MREPGDWSSRAVLARALHETAFLEGLRTGDWTSYQEVCRELQALLTEAGVQSNAEIREEANPRRLETYLRNRALGRHRPGGRPRRPHNGL